MTQPSPSSLSIAIDLPPEAFAEKEPAKVIEPMPEGYTGPYRFWGLRGSRQAGTEQWVSEIVPTVDGPFSYLEHALIPEWWDGRRWVATD